MVGAANLTLPEVEGAERDILAALAEAGEPLRGREACDRAMARGGHRDAAVRAAAWYLIDRGSVAVGPGWTLGLREDG